MSKLTTRAFRYGSTLIVKKILLIKFLTLAGLLSASRKTGSTLIGTSAARVDFRPRR